MATEPEEPEPLDLGAILGNMTDFELVQLSLVALALLHKRAIDLNETAKPKETPD